MTYLIEGQLKGAMEEVDKERDLKEVSESNLQEQATKLAAAEWKSMKAKRACAAAKKRVMDLEGKLDDVDVKLAQVESIISDKDKEIADLKVTKAQREDKFYNMGFTDIENSIKPIMFKSRHYGFGEGCISTVNALDLPNDSPIRDPEQIPLPEPFPPSPMQTSAPNEEEDNLSMRELVEEIDSHTKVINLDIPTTLGASEGQEPPASLLNPNPPDDRICYCYFPQTGSRPEA